MLSSKEVDRKAIMANKHTSKQKNILDIFQKFFVKNNYF